MLAVQTAYIALSACTGLWGVLIMLVMLQLSNDGSELSILHDYGVSHSNLVITHGIAHNNYSL